MIDLPVVSTTDVATTVPSIALVGNPNAGKTTLFNSLTKLQAKTANYPEITVDLRKSTLNLAGTRAELIDLPGMYSLDAVSPEEAVAKSVLRGEIGDARVPDGVVLVVDATNVERNLFLASEILDLGLPTVVALNLIDAAESVEVTIDVDELEKHLHCQVIPVSSRTGQGLSELRQALGGMLSQRETDCRDGHVSCTAGCSGCTFAARYDWAGRVASDTVKRDSKTAPAGSRLDRILTNPLAGVISFLAVMLGVFYLIFSLAGVPMDLIDTGFGTLGSHVASLFPAAGGGGALLLIAAFAAALLTFAAGYRLNQVRWRWQTAVPAVGVSVIVSLLPVEDFSSLIVDGVIGGVGGVVIFLPQICILFFFISLLEDSGYMARAAFVMERLMRSVGLPGKAFVPMLSAHACAIPGIMATRTIENWRDRLVTILVLLLLTCSARLPVYAMVAGLLFSDSPGKATGLFVGAYVLGIGAAFGSAWLLKRTVLRGDVDPLVLELPPWRMPSLRNALLTVIDRALVFLRRAGTIILLISVTLWALATWPRLPEDGLPADVASRVTQLRNEAARTNDVDTADLLRGQADGLIVQEQLAHSVAGRIGRLVEPVFAPLGFDWKLNIGVISSFAAREVNVSTLAIVYGIGEDAAEDEDTLLGTLREQRRSDGSPVYTTATGLSLLVF